MKKALLCMCALIELILSGCPKNEDKVSMDNEYDYDCRTFDAKLLEVKKTSEWFEGANVKYTENEWIDFLYICKYQVVHSTYPDIKLGTVYTVIISKTNTTKDFFEKTIIENKAVFKEV